MPRRSPQPIYDFALAVERVHAAVEATRAPENPVHADGAGGKPAVRATISTTPFAACRRLKAAGADVLVCAGVHKLETIRRGVLDRQAVNLVMGFADPTLTVDQLSAAGVKRISVGGAMSLLATPAGLPIAPSPRTK